jgi:hypothetical protein
VAAASLHPLSGDERTAIEKALALLDD